MNIKKKNSAKNINKFQVSAKNTRGPPGARQSRHISEQQFN